MSLFEELKKKLESAASPEGVEQTRQFLGMPSGEEIVKRTQEGRYALNPLEALGIVGRPIESVTAAPARAAISSLQGNLDMSEAMKAFANQFGRNVDLAPTGEQIAERAGLQGKAAAAAGLGLDVAIDPSSIMGGAALKALPLLGLAGTVAKMRKAEKLTESASDVASASKRALEDINSDYLAAIKANDMKKANELVMEARGIKWKDYSIDRAGAHSPPGPQEGAPAFNLVGAYPQDVYSSEGLRFYSTGAEKNMDEKAYSLLRLARNIPERQMTIYRAVPTSSDTKKIIPGDWVTIVRDYAKEHGESALGGDYKIISKKVRAADIFTAGDSWLEWGYHPQERIPRTIKKDPEGNLKSLMDRFRDEAEN